MGLIFNIFLALIFAAADFLLKLVLIFYVIAFLLLGLYWAFYATMVGWYVLVGITLLAILVHRAAKSKTNSE